MLNLGEAIHFCGKLYWIRIILETGDSNAIRYIVPADFLFWNANCDFPIIILIFEKQSIIFVNLTKSKIIVSGLNHGSHLLCAAAIRICDLDIWCPCSPRRGVRKRTTSRANAIFNVRFHARNFGLKGGP